MKLHLGQSKTTATVGHQRSQHSAGRFLCFKPIGVDFEHLKDKALFYEDKEIKFDSSCEKGSKRKGFSRVLKSILFRSKSRTKNLDDGSWSFRFGKRRKESESEIGLTNASSMRSTSSSCSSSLSSSCLSSHRSESPTMSKISYSSSLINPKPLKQNSLPKKSNIQKQSSFQKHVSLKKQSSGKNQQRQKSVYGSPMVMGVALIVISLALTIFWGRLWAIGLNAVWLCSIPSRSGRKTLTALTLTKTTSLRRSFGSEVSVVEQKRRVIMEGLLDRRHHHHFHHHHHHQNCRHQQQQPMTMP